ncbi:XrtA system polysaccharide deacetylase [Pararhizobium arenae]|uniref:XrtA system polysaccharide deacetylase n=1 Tax=Pararhizobium arenae TaxID=1856850 RepID=UPI00094B4D58|nr:XrtA system polysaccharide deacetylase [Pararhizobium arenae]
MPSRGNQKFLFQNAMSVDVEDYFHASALSAASPRDIWDKMPSRVEASTTRTLTLFADANVKATFFVLGCVARHHPHLVREIAQAGHEIASHGFMHHRVGELSPDDFYRDISDTRKLLEDIAGQPVLGYRAPNFSINAKTWWAYEVLAKAGYRYSSSVNPVPHDHYGVPSAPRQPFRPGADGIVELPLTSLLVGNRRFHASGGGYFRLLPYFLYQGVLRHIIQADERPAHFYFHPWEIDPGQPRLKVEARSRFRHYVNLSAMEGKLRQLLRNFAWARVDAVYAREISAETGRNDCMEWKAA